MSMIEIIAQSKVQEFPDSSKQNAIFQKLHRKLNKKQRDLLWQMRDEAEAAELSNAYDNFYRGFCAGIWFAENSLSEIGVPVNGK